MAQTKEEKNTKERDRYHNRGGKQKLQKKRKAALYLKRITFIYRI